MPDASQFTGLTAAQVEESRRLHGANILTPPAKEPLFKQFLKKFSDPLIIILLIAGVLSVGISCYEYWGIGESAAVFFEPLGIFIAVILATGLAFYFEMKAEHEFEILNRVSDDEAVQVIRDGNHTTIPKKEVVVGDVVEINTGDDIPADGRLVTAVSLSVDESSLTGEPICRKTTDPAHFFQDATYPSDRVLRGTKVMEGHGTVIVDTVGDATESGRVFTAAQIDSSVKTPLDEQLTRLGSLISRMAYAIGILVVAGRIGVFIFTQPFDWISFATYALQSVMIAVTLVVCAVPEGLPMAVTLALAYSMRKMLRTNNLVRRLHACETMGATTVICTDKTGTLTENQMRVFHADFFGNMSQQLIDLGIAVNTTAQLDESGPSAKPVGNPTEGALLLWLKGQGADYAALRQAAHVVEELPFSTERKYMATVADAPDGRRYMFLKGAPEVVFSMCKVTNGVTKGQFDALLLSYQSKAMRTLAFAYADVTGCDTAFFAESKIDAGAVSLIFEGVVAISDPVRADVPHAVAEVQKAGIQVKIVTGDTPATAKEIGRRIGLWDDSTDSDENIIVGPRFDELSDADLRTIAPKLKIIARARPLDKKRLVEALQADGEVVAVTGDGTNDAPALKAAHVGLSMGDGTSVAKEASDITIVNNSFASIGEAVMWGRSLYKNIQRFILFQMTVNVVACLVVLVGAFMGTQSSLTVTQMLWVNIIMDTFAAMALASLPPSHSVMNERPRPRRQFIITPAMWRSIIGYGLVFFVVLIALLYYLRHTHITSLTHLQPMADKANPGLSVFELSVFFTTFVFLQFWNMFNARAFDTHRSAFHFKGCSGFLTIACLILVGQFLIVTFGGQAFGVMPLAGADWLIIIAATSLTLWFGETCRTLVIRRL